MRNDLPKKPRKNETAIINLDDKENFGTHWVSFIKMGNKCLYLDSIGGLLPPKEVIKYLEGCKIYYNMRQYQKLGTNNCGQICVRFLHGHYF